MDVDKAKFETTAWKEWEQMNSARTESVLAGLKKLRDGIAKMCVLVDDEKPFAAQPVSRRPGFQIYRVVSVLYEAAVEGIKEKDESWAVIASTLIKGCAHHSAEAEKFAAMVIEILTDLKDRETLEDRLKRLAVEDAPPRPPIPGERPFRLRRVCQN